MPTPATADSALFQPLAVGPLTLSHRLVMAPLTRFRASTAPEHIPIQPLVSTHYAQRATTPGTLLISEATFISPAAVGTASAPGIWSPAQVDSWSRVTRAVHAQRSFFFCQLWHMGRTAAADSETLHGCDVISSSAIRFDGMPGRGPRAMTEAEIWRTVREYADAARNAIAAGFDGVEIHAANGYLIDQFTQDTCNRRTDAWGGSVEKRSRFCLEVARAVVEAVGRERVGIRLSPLSLHQGMKMEGDKIQAQFGHLIRGLRELGLAYLHLIEGRIQGTKDSKEGEGESLDWAVDEWQGGDKSRAVLLAGGYKPESALQRVDGDRKGQNVGIVFGRLFTSNPDLVYRIREGIPLRNYERKTFYNARQARGYTDWEYSDQYQAALQTRQKL